MRYVFSERAWDDYLYWQKTDRKTLNRINALLKEVAHSLFGYRETRAAQVRAVGLLVPQSDPTR